MASISYTPEPYEQAYFGGLFRAADIKGTGNIGGAEAVQFFARSKLPVEVLKNIWTVADQPSTSSLNPPKFAVALRLIQLTQNGQKGQGANLAVPAGVQLRPVFFEGVSGVSVPMPPPPPGAGQPPPTPQQPQRGMNRGPPPRSPQRQQQPLSPQRQQQQQQPPPTPNSRALVGQDPYVMMPQERARYEALFPEYAKPDGYMYGQEAVALFSKSGVDQTKLRDIWNMVDRPVDNRLDKLEFAMAMHLIVCISKKNLPLPQGGTLPNSLLALKAATAKPAAGPASPTPTSPMRGAIPAPGAPLSPVPQSQMPSPQQQQQPRMQQPPQVETVEETPMVGAPPIVASGGISISDAFEGLSLTSEQQPPAAQQYGSTTPMPPAPVANKSLPAYVPEVPSPAVESAPAPLSPQPASYYSQPAPSIPEPTMAPLSLPPSSSYDLGDAHSELDKLKGVLQKLQAENISLKAQLGNMSEDEKDVQRELGIVVAEIGKLSSELSVQRQQVLEAKNRLLEASAELKAQQEHKNVLTDLISEAQQTKDAINGATASIENANQHHAAMDAQKQEAMNKSDVFESNLFGYEESGPGAAAPALTDSAAEGFNNEPSAGLPPPAENAPLPALGGPSSEPASDMYAQYSAPAPAPAQPEAPPTPQRYEASPTMQRQMVPAQPPQQSQPTPTNLNRPPPVSGHNRQSSGFDSGFVMGGSAPPLPEPSAAPDQASMSSAARAHSSSGDYGFEDEEAFKIVEDMMKKAESAAATARDAEAASSRLASQADELRSDADKADANARTLRAKADEKKDRRFGGGKKKNMLREADQAAQDAAELKKRFMTVQTQAHDAATLAAETRREADRLKNEGEKAEIEMASAASLRDQQKKAPTPAPASNGYGMPPQADYGAAPYGGAPYGGAPAPSYGQAPPPGQAYYGGGGYGQPNGGGYDGGFAAGVMGPGGGQAFDLPSPSGFQQAPPADGYSNPY